MRKLRVLASILLLIFTVNFIPVQAYGGSKFGIGSVWSQYLEDGRRGLYLEFFNETYKDIKEVKLYTKVVNYNINPGDMNYSEVVVDGPTIMLNEKEEYLFKGYLSETQIKDFGIYKIDKIEMFLNDGSKKVSYNSNYYSSLSDNDKENGEVLDYYYPIFEETIPLYFKEGKFEYSTIKLGQDQKYIFNLGNNKENIYVKKAYVEFAKIDGYSNREQVVIAEELEDGSYSAEFNLKNSLDTGRWRASSITIVDNYDREFKLENISWDEFKVVSSNTDVEAPKLNSIEVLSKVYDAKEGTPVKFTLDITDDISGVENAWINITNGDLSEYIYIYNYNYNDDGKFEVEYNNFKANGIWEIKSIEIQDKAGNYITYIQELDEYMDSNRYIQMDFSDKKIDVINFENEVISEDNIEILDLNNNKSEISNGKDVDLEIKLKSDVKIDGINITYRDKNSYKDFWVYAYLNEYDENGNIIENEDGIYTFNVQGQDKVLEYLATGNYNAEYITVNYRNEGNEYRYKYFRDIDMMDNSWMDQYVYEEVDLSMLDVVCNNPNEDITPPEIIDIYVDKDIVTPGEQITIEVKVKDNIDEEIYPPSMYYDGNSNLKINYFYYDNEKEAYIANLDIPEYASTGKYNISYISIRDFVGNYRYYNWYDEEEKELLSKGTILVKSDLNEKLPPEITTNIRNNGETFKAPFKPIVNTDHGSISMLLDGQEYNGEAINKLGNHQLYIEATGVDGSVSTKLVSFNIIAEINNETNPEDIVDQITSSIDKEVVVEVSSDTKEIDKSIFEAIKGEDKTVIFKQEDGTVWSFNGKDIKDENLEGIENIKISVSNEPEEENKESIESLDSGARVIHFDYHGVLPGKATVKIKVDNPQDLMGKDLTFYYFNPETQKAEKVQGPLSIDNEGYVTVEIEHCSDYFLSADDSLHLDEPIITVEKEEIELVEGENKNINATVKPENTKLEYTSSDENIVVVDENGLLTAKSEGEAKITIKALEVTKEITVKVKKKDNEEKPEISGEELKPEEPSVPVVPEEPSKPEEELKPEVPDVKPEEPSVSEEEVKPETPVKPIIILDRDQIELALGQFFNINAKVTPEDKTIEYISSNTNIIEVNKFGLITTKMPGEAIIVVKCEDITREIKVTVKKNEEVTIEGDKIETNTDVIEDNNSNNKNGENQNNLPTTGQVVSSLQLGLAALIVIGVGAILFRKRKNIN